MPSTPASMQSLAVRANASTIWSISFTVRGREYTSSAQRLGVAEALAVIQSISKMGLPRVPSTLF